MPGSRTREPALRAHLLALTELRLCLGSREAETPTAGAFPAGGRHIRRYQQRGSAVVAGGAARVTSAHVARQGAASRRWSSRQCGGPARGGAACGGMGAGRHNRQLCAIACS